MSASVFGAGDWGSACLLGAVRPFPGHSPSVASGREAAWAPSGIRERFQEMTCPQVRLMLSFILGAGPRNSLGSTLRLCGLGPRWSSSSPAAVGLLPGFCVHGARRARAGEAGARTHPTGSLVNVFNS